LEKKTCCKCTHLGEKFLLKRKLHHVDLNKAAFINELGKYNVTVFGETLEELEQEFLTPRKLTTRIVEKSEGHKRI